MVRPQIKGRRVRLVLMEGISFSGLGLGLFVFNVKMKKK
jgi:hypothetical protein